MWFRRDLRLHDHPGLALALRDIQAAHRDDCTSPSPASLALVYVFDSEECAALPLDALEYLVGAVRCLRQTIQTGSGGRADLYVRVGAAADQVAQLCQQLHVQKVYVEDDWSELGQQALQRARAASVPLQLWQPLRMSHLPEVNAALRDATPADDTEVTLPPVVEFFDQYRQRAVAVSLSAAEERAPFEHVLRWVQRGAARWSVPEGTTTWGEIPSAEALQRPTTIHSSSTRHLHAYVGERGAERLLHSFLTTRDSASTTTDTIRALSLPLWLGCISPHRAHAFIRAQAAAAPFDGRRRAAARDALAFLQQREWHLHLATQDRHQQHAWHYWDWQGVPIRYARWAPSTLTPASAAVLLVHGFGASIEHWQHNAEVLARHGYPVYAVDLVGFGRSMKPPAQYTPDWWRQQLLDFVQQVVRQPVYVMGNSIGAYMSLSFAAAAVGAAPAEATAPSRSRSDTVAAPWCRGVVLINAAGPIREPSLPPPPPPSPLSLRALLRTPSVAWLSAEAILWYLQRNIRRTLQRVYPVNPHASTRLERIIYRSSTDPGAKHVLWSGFRLPPARPINELIQALAHTHPLPVLMLQGALDPLGKAGERGTLLKTLCPTIELVLLNAGHCPHDEVPEQVNAVLLEWLQRQEQQSQQPETEDSASATSTQQPVPTSPMQAPLSPLATAPPEM